MAHGEAGPFGLLLVVILDTTARLVLACRCCAVATSRRFLRIHLARAKGELLARKVASLVIAKRRQRARNSNLRQKSKKAGSQRILMSPVIHYR